MNKTMALGQKKLEIKNMYQKQLESNLGIIQNLQQIIGVHITHQKQKKNQVSEG